MVLRHNKTRTFFNRAMLEITVRNRVHPHPQHNLPQQNVAQHWPWLTMTLSRPGTVKFNVILLSSYSSLWHSFAECTYRNKTSNLDIWTTKIEIQLQEHQFKGEVSTGGWFYLFEQHKKWNTCICSANKEDFGKGKAYCLYLTSGRWCVSGSISCLMALPSVDTALLQLWQFCQDSHIPH